jgi:hypothetical protein
LGSCPQAIRRNRRRRDGFAAKKLGLSADAADSGIKAVVETKGARQAVTLYDLLAEAAGTVSKLS